MVTLEKNHHHIHLYGGYKNVTFCLQEDDASWGCSIALPVALIARQDDVPGATVEVIGQYVPQSSVSWGNGRDFAGDVAAAMDDGGGGGGGGGDPEPLPSPRGFYVVQDWTKTQDFRFLGGGSWDNYSFVDSMPNCGAGLSNSFASSWEGSISVGIYGAKIGYSKTVTLIWTTGITVSPRRHGELLLYAVMWECQFADEKLFGTDYGSARQAMGMYSVYADRPL